MKYEIIKGDISPVTKQPLQYKKLENGTCYSINTPDTVIKVLEKLRETQQRVKLYYGDRVTGGDWEEEFDTKGRISRSTGNIKIPLLINNRRSYGGGTILTDCIVKIELTTKPHTVLYQHPNFHKRTDAEIKAAHEAINKQMAEYNIHLSNR